jgi:hypothetical protein
MLAMCSSNCSPNPVIGQLYCLVVGVTEDELFEGGQMEEKCYIPKVICNMLKEDFLKTFELVTLGNDLITILFPGLCRPD